MNEEWRDIKDYVGYYQVSNTGKVRSLIQWNGKRYVKRKEPYLLAQSNTTTGYKKVELCKERKRRSHKVHRLVAQAFILNPLEKPNVNHIDHDPFNNHVNNLEWATQSENVIHSAIFKRRRIVPIEDEPKVIMLYKQKKSGPEIAKMYGCSQTPIYDILKRNNIERRSPSEIRNKYGIDLELFKKYVDEGKSNKEIQRLFNCSEDIVSTRRYQYKKGII